MHSIRAGKHADSSPDFQEFMIMPQGAPNFREGLRCRSERIAKYNRLLEIEDDLGAVAVYGSGH